MEIGCLRHKNVNEQKLMPLSSIESWNTLLEAVALRKYCKMT